MYIKKDVIEVIKYAAMMAAYGSRCSSRRRISLNNSRAHLDKLRLTTA
ncbi:Uncharacterised protein [Pseudomonas aeruginosa]|nr:Uncharacterised protein [Pseudomonas aeruginosa]